MQGSGSATLMLWDLSGVVGEQHASGAGTCSEGESHLALQWVPHLTDDSCRFRGTITSVEEPKQTVSGSLPYKEMPCFWQVFT